MLYYIQKIIVISSEPPTLTVQFFFFFFGRCTSSFNFSLFLSFSLHSSSLSILFSSSSSSLFSPSSSYFFLLYSLLPLSTEELVNEPKPSHNIDKSICRYRLRLQNFLTDNFQFGIGSSQKGFVTVHKPPLT